MIRIALFFLFLFSITVCRSQSKSAGLEAALQYCSNFKRIPKDSLGLYARQSVRLATELNDKPRLARAYAYLARFYLNSSLPDSALLALDQVDRFYGKDRASMLAKNNADMMRGSLFVKQNRHKEAIKWYFGIMDRVRLNDTFNYLGVLHGIGWANMELGRFNEAKRWFLKVVQFPDTVYEASRVITMCNLSATYAALHELDSAEFYLQRTITLSRKHHSLIAEANALNIYGDLLIEQKQYAEAEEKISAAITIRKQIGDPFYIISDLAQLSSLYAEWGKYSEGQKAGEQALRMADSLDIDAKLPMIYEALRRNYSGAGAYKKSADIAGTLLRLKDSLNNKSSTESIAEMEVRYESAQKEHQIHLQRSALMRKNMLIYGTLTFSILLCLLFVVLWRLNRQVQQKRLQQAQLKEQEKAAKAVLAAEEQERQRLSEVLHDGLGQQLSALKMNLQVVRPAKESEHQVLTNAMLLTNSAIDQVRNLSHGLSPRNVLHRGLPLTIKELATQIPAQQLEISLDLDEAVNALPPETQLSLFRIIQEAMNNVLKYAGARHFLIQARLQADHYQWRLSDDGQGFDPAQTAQGIGLSHIAARVRLLNGSYTLRSAPGTGTDIFITFPVK
jgi:signal transduction histidine kinase